VITDVTNIRYRPAQENDYEFCRILHHQGMKPYVEPLWGWNDDFQNPRYAKLWQPIRIKIIQYDGKDVGYFETSAVDSAVKLVNIFVIEELRGQGIGGQVVLDFINQYKAVTPKLILNVLWNNPAKHLYERLGFKFVLKEDQILKYELCFK